MGAALLLLDYVSTSVVSAATAAAYLSGEVNLPFPSFVGTIIVLVLFTLISLSGIKESARLALVSLSFHVSLLLYQSKWSDALAQVGTMIVLMVASAIHWGNIGNDQLRENWVSNQASSTSKVARHIFDGWCLGMLGLTGFECWFLHSFRGLLRDVRFRYTCLHRSNQTRCTTSCISESALSRHSLEHSHYGSGFGNSSHGGYSASR